MYNVIKSGVNNKTFNLNGLNYRKGFWNIYYCAGFDVDRVLDINTVTCGVHYIYDHSIFIAKSKLLTHWRYNDLKTFDDMDDFVKRVSKLLGY